MAFASDFWRMWRVAGIFVVTFVAAQFVQRYFLGAGNDFYAALALSASPLLLLQAIIAWSRWIDASPKARLWATAVIALCAGLYALAGMYASLDSTDRALWDSVFWAASLISVAVTYWLIYRSARLSPPPPHLDETAAFAEEIAALADPMPAKLAENLMRESERMRRLSFLTLGGVAVLMSVAVLVVLFAGVITSLDLTGANPLQKAESYASSARNALADAENTLQRLQAQERVLKRELEAALESGATRSPRDKESVVFELDQVSASVLRQQSEIPFLQQTKSAALELLDTVRKQDVLGQDSAAIATAQTSEALIASAVTRFGVIAVLMFLAQALINLYRYALRLSAFYRSRALMVVLTGGDLAQMEAAAKTMSADHVSLGREPKSPIEDAKRLAEIAKDLKT